MSGERTTFTDDQEHQRLLAALRESEILRELAALLASSLDLNHILRVLVKRTTEVCEVARCAVWLLDDALNVLRPAAYHLDPRDLIHSRVEAADHLWYHTPLPLDDPVIQRLLEGQGMFTLEDLRAESTMQPIAEKFFVRSVLFVALVREGRPVGMMTLDDPGKLRTFSQKHQQLACAIGQQAAIAIDNARLYQQAQMERKRAEQLIERAQAVNQVALAVNAGEDLTAVLKIAIYHLVQGLKADGGAIVLLEADTLRLATTTRLQQHLPIEQTTIALSDLPHCYQAAITGAPLFVTAEQAKDAENLWYSELGLDNTMIVPLMVGTRCVGLSLVNYHNPFYRPSKGQYAFALDIAAQCALAVDKAHILAEAHEAVALATERANTLNTVFHAMTEGVSVLNLEGQVVMRNAAAAYFLGENDYSKDRLAQILQRHPAYTVHGQLVNVDDFPVTRSLRGERIRGERLLVRRADGAERFIEFNVEPLLDGVGKQVGVVSGFRDVTQQLRTEQHIRQALETMLHVAVAVSGMTNIKDILRNVLEMTLTSFNCDRGSVHIYDEDQQLFVPLLACGFSPEAEKHWLTEEGQWYLDSQAHQVSDDQAGKFETALMDGHATVINTQQYPQFLETYNDTTLIAAPITNAKHLLGLMVLDCSAIFKQNGMDASSEQAQQRLVREFTIWDMAVIEGVAQLAGLAIEQTRWQEEATNARMSEAAMREANALKDEFLAITAHEFRTPLTIILANSQFALRALRRRTNKLTEHIPELSEVLRPIVENLSTIVEQTHQLTNIVNSFLEVTQINRGQLGLNLEEVDLAEIATQVVASYSKTSPDHDVGCCIEPGRYPYLVKGDSAHLLQVLTNLVQNAIKYSPHGGPVHVSLRQLCNNEDKTIIELCVEDKGIGVPKEAQSHLFERFYRASNTSDSKVRGIGLGLYLVAELLRLHGGTIRVESSGIPGEGSRFICLLPALESEIIDIAGT
jgi:PAS domain S-box-containing protein